MPIRTRKRDKTFGRLGLKQPRATALMGGKRGAMHPDHAEFFTALGRRIRELRKEKGWSLHHMVANYGYYQSQWQKYEKGGPVTVDSLLKMATMFELSLCGLLQGLGDFPRPNPSTEIQEPTVATKTAKASKKTVAQKVRTNAVP